MKNLPAGGSARKPTDELHELRGENERLRAAYGGLLDAAVRGAIEQRFKAWNEQKDLEEQLAPNALGRQRRRAAERIESAARQYQTAVDERSEICRSLAKWLRADEPRLEPLMDNPDALGQLLASWHPSPARKAGRKGAPMIMAVLAVNHGGWGLTPGARKLKKYERTIRKSIEEAGWKPQP